MASEDRDTKILRLRGLMSLSGLGGFIQDYVEENVRDLYTPEIIEIVERYCPLGPGFWDVAAMVEKAKKPGYGILAASSKIKMNEGFEITSFVNWRAEQVARLQTIKVNNRADSFWNDWNLSRDTRKALLKLSPAEERVLYLIKGIGGKRMSVSEVASLPEFNCREDYIRLLCAYAESLLSLSNGGVEEFYDQCRSHR